jgi:hypothetical protein
LIWTPVARVFVSRSSSVVLSGESGKRRLPEPVDVGFENLLELELLLLLTHEVEHPSGMAAIESNGRR